MSGKWDADPTVNFRRRLGKSPQELDNTSDGTHCPELWELDNGDVAVIGTDLTSAYTGRLPDGVDVASWERLVVIPRSAIISAKADIPDA